MAAVTLFNGAHQAILGDASISCLTAFNSTLNCDPVVQMLSYDLDRLAFTEASLTSLCKPACLSSLLTLESAVTSACGDYDVEFNGGFLSATEIVDFFLYKYNTSCLADSKGSFCLLVEETWDVSSLNSSGTATWPTFTNKTYPDFTNNPDGSPGEDGDGNPIDDSDESPVFQSYPLELDQTGQDYYQDGIPLNWTGHGWLAALEYDEYPLEIQCSECFLAQYRFGIESRWGEVFDEVSDQVWNNIQANCNLNWELSPANNLSTWATNVGTALAWSHNPTCGQTVIHAPGSDTGYITANDLAFTNNVSTAALIALNSISWNSVSPGSYCAPEPCQVAVVNHTTSAQNYVALNSGISETQFWAWNNYMDSNNLITGEIVCVGPPGGAYSPIVFPPAAKDTLVPALTQTVDGTAS
ncbi:hypothetical protein F5Y14DRAFT_460583 [Nemania sp. NC0429]|nr:hypothetical protein F5Y14DRAFT_460583 [Nemania sp. NC0429]